MISEAIKVLQAGEELKNSTSWKNLQATTGAVVAIAGAAIMVLKWVGVEINATPDQITAIAGGVAGVLGVFNTYATLATSKRVGMQPSNGGDAGPGINNN